LVTKYNHDATVPATSFLRRSSWLWIEGSVILVSNVFLITVLVISDEKVLNSGYPPPTVAVIRFSKNVVIFESPIYENSQIRPCLKVKGYESKLLVEEAWVCIAIRPHIYRKKF